MRVAPIAIASVALTLFALCELGLAYPVAWWLYLSIAIAFAAGFIRPVSVRSQIGRLGRSQPSSRLLRRSISWTGRLGSRFFATLTGYELA